MMFAAHRCKTQQCGSASAELTKWIIVLVINQTGIHWEMRITGILTIIRKICFHHYKRILTSFFIADLLSFISLEQFYGLVYLLHIIRRRKEKIVSIINVIKLAMVSELLYLPFLFFVIYILIWKDQKCFK